MEGGNIFLKMEAKKKRRHIINPLGTLLTNYLPKLILCILFKKSQGISLHYHIIVPSLAKIGHFAIDHSLNISPFVIYPYIKLNKHYRYSLSKFGTKSIELTCLKTCLFLYNGNDFSFLVVISVDQTHKNHAIYAGLKPKEPLETADEKDK